MMWLLQAFIFFILYIGARLFYKAHELSDGSGVKNHIELAVSYSN